MLARTGFFGLLALVVYSGLAVASPPINPFVEGREPNPVIREFHELEKPIPGYETGPIVPPRTRFGDQLTAIENWKTFLAALISNTLHQLHSGFQRERGLNAVK